MEVHQGELVKQRQPIVYIDYSPESSTVMFRRVPKSWTYQNGLCIDAKAVLLNLTEQMLLREIFLLLDTGYRIEQVMDDLNRK